MTYYPPPYPPPVPRQPYPPPPVAPRQPNYAKVSAFVAVALLAVITLVVLVVGLHRSGSTTTASTPTTSTLIQSSSDDWFDAVCRPGSLRSDYGSRLPNALSGGYCVSSVDGLAIDIGQYNSEYAARNDGMGQYVTGSYAIIRDTGGWMLFRNINDKTGASLQPLAKFGFVVTSGRG